MQSRKIRKILIIDDNVEYHKVLGRFIHSLYPHIEIRTCDNGKDGVKIAENWLPDIMFVDYSMPVMDGLMVVQIIKNSLITQNIMIVMISADAIDPRGCSFAKKPISKPYIQKLIEDMQNTRIIHT